LNRSLRLDNRVTQCRERGKHFAVIICHRGNFGKRIRRLEFIFQMQRHFLRGLFSHARDAAQQIGLIGKDRALDCVNGERGQDG